MAITLDGSDNKIAIGANATGSAYLRLYEDTDNGTNYVDIIAPSSITSNRTLTLPDATGTLVTNSGTEAGAFSTLSINSNNISAENSLGFRNRIINGDMRIDQRNAGAAVTASGSYPVDRFVMSFTSSAGTFSAQQSTTVVPTGFTSSTGVTITAADSSIAANEILQIQQWIEGNNIADLGFGTASAKTVTISFWVRSSVTGIYGFAIANSSAGTGAPNRSYVSEYTISAANTWEYKTVTIPGDTSGTWQTGNLRGMSLRFALTAGTDFQQSAGSWGTGNVNTTSNQTQLLSTNGATFYITGVQLEVGSVATPFERRPYGTELALCQRYYYRKKADVVYGLFGSANIAATATAYVVVPFPVPMRTTPSALEQSGTATDYRVYSTVATACNAVPTYNTSTSSTNALVQFTTAATMTAGYAAFGSANNTTNAYLGWSAEL